MVTELPNIDTLRTKLQTTWASRNDHIEQMRKLRFGEIAPQMPPTIRGEPVITPLAYSMVERIVGTLTTDPMSIEVRPPEESNDKDNTRASVMEKGTLALLDQLASQADEDVIERYVECLAADGTGCMRMLYAPQHWTGYPEKEKRESAKDYNKRCDVWKRGRDLPISWTWIDPMSVYPMWSEMGMECILESDLRDPLTIEADMNAGRFNVAKDNPDIWQTIRHSTSAQMCFEQFWTRDTFTYLINKQVVHHEKHKYNRIPYVYSTGATTSTRDPGKMGLSMLFPLRHMIPYLDTLLTQKASAIRLWCWPTPVVKQVIGAGSLPDLGLGATPGTPQTIEVSPGRTVTLLPGQDISFLTWTGNGPDADEMVQIIMGLIEKAGLSSVMYGQAEGGDSGYLVNQLIGAARMKYRPVIAHSERGMEQMVRQLWDIIEYQIKGPVYVYGGTKRDGGWLALGPDLIQGYRNVKCNLHPLLPTDAYAVSSRAINELQAGLRDVRSSMEMIGIEQPDEMERRILVDKWKRRPEVEGFLTAEALKRAKIALDQEQPRDLAPADLMGVLPMLPPALQQALMAGPGGLQAAQTGGMPPDAAGALPVGAPPNAGGPMGTAVPGVLAAPGVMAVPPSSTEPPVGQAMEGRTLPRLGKRAVPAGKATGRAPGVKKRGSE